MLAKEVFGMQSIRFEILIYSSLFLTLFTFGCAVQETPLPEVVLIEQAVSETSPETEPEPEIAPEVVEEYARIHQISDLKTAEHYIKNPDYAKENPYTPTGEDIAFYEKDFLEKMYPNFKKVAEKQGFMAARSIYMRNPPAGPGSRQIGSTKYAAMIEQLATGGGNRASQLMFENDPAGIRYQNAMTLYKEDRLDEAIEEMEAAVEIKPDAPGFLYNLGVMYREKGDYAKAVPILKRALAYIKATGYTKVNLAMYSDAYVGSCVNLGLIYTRIGMYEEAIKILKEAIQFKPRDLDANYNLGNVYYVMGDIEKASEQMRKFINLDPNNAEAHNIAGLMYYRRGLHSAALDEFQTAVKLAPDEKQYSHNAGLVLAKLDREDEANQAFEQASGLGKGQDLRREYAEQTAVNKAREMYNEGHSAMEDLKITKAIELFKAVLELDPDMIKAHFNLGVCYRMRKRSKEQIHHFEEVVRLEPDMPDARYNLGLAYSDARMYPQAMAEFKQAIKLKPPFKDAVFQLGTVLYKTENYTDAAVQFEKCLELSSGWFEALLNLGSCYLKTENADGAIEQFKKAVQAKPDSAEAHYSLAEAYMRVEKFDEASVLLQKAIVLDPGHRLARVRLKELESFLDK